MTEMTKAERLQAALLAAREKAQGKGNQNGGARRSGGDNASFAFWNLPYNTSATVRFLPDGNPDNDFFWVNKEVIKLPFAGVVGGEYPTSKDVTVNVPCVSMFGMQCPITNAIRPWWKDDSKMDLARTYYRKRSYIFQGFVVGQNPLNEEAPENPIRRFVINKSIFDIIEPALANAQFEDLPIDYVGGRDFNITRTKKGDYANYATSQWSFKTRSLGDAELQAIDQYGLFNLKEAQGRIPDADELAAIEAMFYDSLAGKPFDVDSYGKWYRAFGGGNDGGNAGGATPGFQGSAASQTDNRVADQFSNPAPEAASLASAPSAGGAKLDADSILASIRDRALNNR